MKLQINFRAIINSIPHTLKKYLGEIIFTVGSGLTVYNLAGFVHKAKRFYTPQKPPSINETYWSGYSYYSDWQKILITLGVVLIIVGIFIIKNRRNNSGQTLV